MPTISQLPVATSAGPADEVLISQAGTTSSITVGNLLAGTQPAIMAPTGALLGRVSLGVGGPEPITVGIGLTLAASAVEANGADHASFAQQTTLQTTDQAVLNSNGTPMLLSLSMLRGLFSAGANVTIDGSGVISATGGGGSSVASGGSGSIAALAQVATLGTGDLIAVSQGGTDYAITFGDLIDGETIDELVAAAPVADTDTLPVGQGTSTMLAQTFGAVWTWIQARMPLYKVPVVELTANTTLDGSAHNGRVLVCSSAVTLTHSGTEGSGFSCTIINASSGSVTLDSGIITTSGVSTLSPGQMAELYCVTYSAGTVTYARMSGPLAAPPPGQVTSVVVGAITYSSVALTWSAPASGGAPTGYTVEYRVTGSSAWSTQTTSATSATISGLSPSAEYDIQVLATNAGGNGTASAIVYATTPAAPTSVPGQVTGLAASSPSASSIVLNWVAPSVGGAVGTYTAQYRVTGQAAWITAASGILALTTTIGGLTASTEYDFQVYAVNSAGNGTPSPVTNGTTTIVAPGTPSALTAGAVTQTTAMMSWTAPSSGGPVSSYTLQYRVTGAGAWSQLAGLTATSTTITGLTAGTSYDVQVAAVNAGGTSAFTPTTNAMTVVGLPGTPSGLIAGVATSGTQPLSWTSSASGGTVATYSVRYSVHGANSWTSVTGITGTSTTIMGLTASTSYDYEVQSVNAGGSSAWSAITSNSTAAPSNYLLTIGNRPLPGAAWAVGSGGNPINVNVNTAAIDGSHTQPALDQYGFSTSTTVPPPSWANMIGAPYYVQDSHNYDTQYANAPSVAGTYYVWFQALDSTNTVQFTFVCPNAITVS
jgi:hypothetical protein